MEFLQFWDQHRGSFSRISAAGWSFSYAPANRSWSGPLQNLGFGAPMSTICKTFSQIASPTSCVWSRVINVSQQSNRFLYLEIIHVSDQLRSDQITIIYRVSSLMYHSSSSIYHASLIIQHLSCIISHLSPIIHHLSSSIYHRSSTTYHAASVISLHLHQHQHPHHSSTFSPQPSPVSYFRSNRLNYD